MICLSRRDFSETSQILVVMSRRHGKISLLAKGIKRPRKKTAGGIDLLDVGTVRFIKSNQNLSLLTEFQPDTGYPGIRSSLAKWYASLYLAEVVDLSTKEEEPAPELFDLLIDSIEKISKSTSNEDLAKILIFTLIKILSLIGYKPQFDTCVNCKRNLTPGDTLFFTASGGGIICGKCKNTVKEKIHIEHRAWYYLKEKVKDLTSASKVFDLSNYMLSNSIEKNLKMTSYCKNIFTQKKINIVSKAV